MLDNNIYEDLLARCGGNIHMVVAGANSAGKTTLKEGLNKLSLTNVEECGTEDLVGVCEHSDFAICVTADGSFGGVSRDDLAKAEELTVDRLKKSGKPFVIVLNCVEPANIAALQLKGELESKFTCPVLALNCLSAEESELSAILKAVLFEFPVTTIDVNIPDWIRVMPKDSSAVAELLERLKGAAEKITTLRDCDLLDSVFADSKYWKGDLQVTIYPSTGRVVAQAYIKDGILFEMLSEICGEEIGDECALMQFAADAATAKRNYGKVKDAFECASVTGYGIVAPCDDDMSLEKPQVVKQGGNIGIRLKATAPSYHIVKVDISGEVSPIMGAATTSEEMVNGIMNGFENDPEGMWDSNLFGKSLRGMVKDGLYEKVNCMHEDTRVKMRRAITRIINESKGNVICILL